MSGRLPIFLLFLLCSGLSLRAQSPSIAVTVNKDRILIGEPLVLTIEVQRVTGSLLPVLRIDSIPHFEFSGPPVIDSSRQDAGWRGKAVYTLTSFDSGQWMIPAISIAAGIRSEPVGVSVVFSDFDPQQDYHDIKDILDLPAAMKRSNRWWYIAGAVLIAGLLGWYWLRKRKPAPLPVTAPSVTPYEEALQQLTSLEKEGPDRMEYHNRLTAIFRLYIYRKKGLHSLQRTTGELVLQLQQLNLEKNILYRLTQALRLSDFVKFARFQSGTADDAEALTAVREAIRAIENLETAAVPATTNE